MNPLWILNNSSDDERIQRFFSTTELSYELTPWLTALYRIGIDQYSQNQIRTLNRGGTETPDGRMTTSNRQNRITDQLVNLLYNYQINEDLSLDGILGANLRNETRDASFLLSTNQLVFGLFNHGNFIDHRAFSGITKENTCLLYTSPSPRDQRGSRMPSSA